MRFWDSSALVSLFLPELGSSRVIDVARSGWSMALWWATPIECFGALARAKHSGRITHTELQRAERLLTFLLSSAEEIQPWDEIRQRARHLISRHPLRAADALQLAAALEWSGEKPEEYGFVCLDDRLCMAAALEGFRVLPYPEMIHEPQAEYGTL